MKTMRVLFASIFICLFLLTGLFTVAEAANNDCQKFNLATNCQLSAGQEFSGNIYFIGGHATFEPDSMVTNDVYVIGSSLENSGAVKGSVYLVGGTLSNNENAIINGNIFNIGSQIISAPGSQVLGDVRTAEDIQSEQETGKSVTFFGVNFPLTKLLLDYYGFMVQTLLITLFGILAAVLFPKPFEKLASTPNRDLLKTLGFGLLTFVTTLISVILLAITLIGIPLSLLILILVFLLSLFGWFGIGIWLGRKIEQTARFTWSTPVEMGIGILMLLIFMRLIVSIPCLGAFLQLLLYAFGLGMAILYFIDPASPIPFVRQRFQAEQAKNHTDLTNNMEKYDEID